MGRSAPEHLPEDVAAVWLELIEGVARPGPDFKAYCGQVARLRDAQSRISREGLVVADEKGRPVPHPALEIERRAQVEIRAWGNVVRAMWSGRSGCRNDSP